MRRHRGGYDYWLEAGDPSLPVLVLLHGTGDDARSFMALGRTLLPEATRVSVQGNVDEHGMARFFRRAAMGVYDMADLEARTDAFAAFLGELARTHALDPARIVGLGYSNGANLLANLAFRHPSAMRRMMLLHPLIPFEPPASDLATLDVLVTAGRTDPICPWPLTERLVRVLEMRGAAVTLVDHPGGHELVPAELDATRAFVAG
ncbi:MAG: alpha/beta hydrolase [Pseudomonadota bacterium]